MTVAAGSSKTEIPRHFYPRIPLVSEKTSMDSHILADVYIRSVRLICSQN